ncbi:dual specificity mitogen-activated protein kinase kinase 5 isoform X3 [Phyllopteryx taeniolatus]|uniref:dual specificity mitogen-activated protein kinase kinase 5 isoform X3 n=1 Tax=Phyllopteryx taeniolatus TaxID=161469 RepID=UPI002AD3C0E8|nr:dual specificity mitogen-activated protein kinase kinase 5 isoform X3 [Phyllopteryx taeniolatus]
MLYFNSIFIMDSAGIVIRIKTPLGDMDSSVDCPSLLNFSDLLVAIRDVMPEATVTAFEYEDEVGDRITVRSDEELKAMLSYVMHPADVRLPFQYAVQTKKGIQHPRVERPLRLRRRKYCSTMNEQRMNGQLPEPLQIFPRAGKTPGIRNIHGLKVNTRPNPANDCTTGVTDTMANNSLKKSSAELKRILTTGQINAQDIQYQEQLGQGNGGTVYKAYHLLGKRVLAVKVIPLDITVELQKQIMSELEILYKCDSPYIITFFSAFFVENRISICTEFMDGGSLDVYKRIPEHVLGRIAVAVVKGLTYLWSLKILHRDVKPSNMLVNTRGQVKLCDFGVSTQLVNSIAKTYVGTNAYMAPERISGEQYGIHADVWSVGISFMELALGMFPYPQLLPVWTNLCIMLRSLQPCCLQCRANKPCLPVRPVLESSITLLFVHADLYFFIPFLAHLV